MPIFCTKCGTANEDGAGFCDNCGAKLRAPSVSIPDDSLTATMPTGTPRLPVQLKVSSVNSKKIVYAGVAFASVLVLGGGAMYFMLQPPAATASTLLAAAKAGYGNETTNRFKNELCVSNTDYSRSTFNAGENDQSTQAWMNALVTAGLYNPPVVINSGGFFSHNLLQYAATAELEKYRQGSKLCIAKDVEFSEVTDIEKPEEQLLGSNSGSPKVLTVKAKLLLKSLYTAPWMEKPEVRDVVMANINGWEYKDKTLQKKITESFGLKDSKWATGIGYKEELKKQYKNLQRGTHSGDLGNSSVAATSDPGGLGSVLSSLLTFGNPLKGTWRTAATSGGFGGNIPAGIGPNLTFTSDSMESMGQSTSVDFSVDGKRVKVTPKGQNQSFVFVMETPDTMVAQALDGMRYERVR